MKYRAIVRVLLRNKEDKFLAIFLPSKNGIEFLTELPGGEVEITDTPWQRACKEVKEEVGINIDYPKHVSMIGYDYKNHPIRAIGWLFVAEVNSGSDITIGDDTIDHYKWLEYEDLIKTLQFSIPSKQEIVSALGATS